MTAQKGNLISRFEEVPYRDLLEGYPLLLDGLYQKELTALLFMPKIIEEKRGQLKLIMVIGYCGHCSINSLFVCI